MEWDGNGWGWVVSAPERLVTGTRVVAERSRLRYRSTFSATLALAATPAAMSPSSSSVQVHKPWVRGYRGTARRWRESMVSWHAASDPFRGTKGNTHTDTYHRVVQAFGFFRSLACRTFSEDFSVCLPEQVKSSQIGEDHETHLQRERISGTWTCKIIRNYRSGLSPFRPCRSTFLQFNSLLPFPATTPWSRLAASSHKPGKRSRAEAADELANWNRKNIQDWGGTRANQAEGHIGT